MGCGGHATPSRVLHLLVRFRIARVSVPCGFGPRRRRYCLLLVARMTTDHLSLVASFPCRRAARHALGVPRRRLHRIASALAAASHPPYRARPLFDDPAESRSSEIPGLTTEASDRTRETARSAPSRNFDNLMSAIIRSRSMRSSSIRRELVARTCSSVVDVARSASRHASVEARCSAISAIDCPISLLLDFAHP